MTEINKQNKTLGQQIQKYRKRKGFSQEKLAEKLDISRAHMGHIEQGRKKPSLDLLEDIAKELNINIRNLFP